ncbi:hypothetical protein GPB2148_1289 [marine gamma proteobacterium HTCC2148]|nr:hypothetical protein GPB2148_1289 [marine gamma proteobacterium HTCC2148]
MAAGTQTWTTTAPTSARCVTATICVLSQRAAPRTVAGVCRRISLLSH